MIYYYSFSWTCMTWAYSHDSYTNFYILNMTSTLCWDFNFLFDKLILIWSLLLSLFGLLIKGSITKNITRVVSLFYSPNFFTLVTLLTWINLSFFSYVIYHDNFHSSNKHTNTSTDKHQVVFCFLFIIKFNYSICKKLNRITFPKLICHVIFWNPEKSFLCSFCWCYSVVAVQLEDVQL